jgi:AcrR family transcriptional regulator
MQYSAVTPRGRPAGRTKLQQEQKNATRDRLLRAAEQIFSERPYAAIPVEEIIQRAGASRTSFYRHFDSKWAVASALCAEVMPKVWQLWEELATCRQPSEQQLAEWLERRIGLYHAHRSLFETLQEAAAIEPVGLNAINQNHDETIRILGTGIPAFALALSADAGSHEVYIRAHLLLTQLDDFNYRIAVRGWPVDRGVAVRVMAQQFMDFIQKAERCA